MRLALVPLFAVILAPMLTTALAPFTGSEPVRAAEKEGKILLAVYPDWGRHAGFPAAKVPFALLTHLAYSGFVTDATGAVRPDDVSDGSNRAELLDKAHAAGVKVLFSVKAEGPAFETMISRPSARARFIRTLLATLDREKADGVDLAWDRLSPGDGDDRLALVRELRLALDAGGRGALLSSTVTAEERWAGAHEDEFFTLPNILVVSASGFDGRDRHVQPVSSLEAGEEALRRFEKRGVIPARMVLESPFFGRSFDGAAGLGSGYLGKGSGTDGSWRWKDLLVHLRTWEYRITSDAETRSEVATGQGEAIVFLGIPSQKARGERLRAGPWGGAAVLDLASDTLDVRKSLLAALQSGLRGLPKGFAFAPADTALAAAAKAATAKASPSSAVTTETSAATPIDFITDRMLPGLKVLPRQGAAGIPLPSMSEGKAKEGDFALEAVLPAGSGCALCAPSPFDLSGPRAAWELRFWIQGAEGDESLHVGFEDDGSNGARRPLKVRANVRSHGRVTREWSPVRIPLSTFGTRGAAEERSGGFRFATFHWAGVRCLTLDADLGLRDPVRVRLDAVRVGPAGALERPTPGPGYLPSNDAAAVPMALGAR
jgi:hypothetical protein